MQSAKTLLCPLSLSLCLATTSLAQAPGDPVLPYTGHIDKNGAPVTGSLDLAVDYFLAEADASPCGSEIDLPVQAHNGAFSTLLVVPALCLGGPGLYLEVSVRPFGGDYIDLAGRQAVWPALKARGADDNVPFSLPAGARIGSARLEGVAGLTGFPSSSGVRLVGPPNANVLIDVRANQGGDAFAVRVPETLAVDAEADTVAFQVRGDGVTVAEKLEIGALNSLFGADGSTSGCLRLGEIQICWGRYPSNLSGNTPRVVFERPFRDTRYALTCTPLGATEELARFCFARDLTTDGFHGQTHTPNGLSGIGGSYIAIGRW